MNVKVTEECIACQQCVEICPEVFQMGDEYAEVQMNPVPAEHEEAVKEAAQVCPVDAIVLE